jgi:HD-GYP domain-containing protein (c-di-GMP phosphodiesterase class II)
VKIRKVSPADLKVGMLIPWNVYNESGGLLVRKGHLIASAAQIEALVERGSFEDDSEQGAQTRGPDSVLRKLNAAQLELQMLLKAIALRVTPPDLRRQLEDVARLVDEAVALSADTALAAILHNQQAMPYPVRHSVDTAVLAQVLARAVKMAPAPMLSMTLAALTMNVGMLEQHERLHASRAPLSVAEQAMLQAHPQRGVDLLRQAGIDDPLWLDCVLSHHENEDGSGYPAGRSGADLAEAAKIIAIADRYSARVAERGYRKNLPPNTALREILLEAGRTLDGQLAAVLIRELGIYPIGTYVRLINGEIGVVSRKGLNPTTPHVESIVGPRGAPLDVFLRRDTRGDLHGIREVLAAAQVNAPFRMEQIWGRVASL